MTGFDRAIRTAAVIVIVLLAASCKVHDLQGDKAWNDFAEQFRHDLQMDGYKLHYIDMGRGEPVLMLHGFASTSYCWHNNVGPLLDSGLRVILVDLPGQGWTEVPPDTFIPTVENMAAEVIKLADALNLGRFALVGSSMGGGLTLFLSWRYPERISRAVVIDPASFEQERPGHLKLLNNRVIGKILVRLAGRWAVKSALKDTVYNKDVIDDAFVDEYARPMAKPGYKDFIVSLLTKFFSEKFGEMVESYDRISVPLLIVWGLEDTWVPPEFGPRLNELVPGSRYVGVEECGHMPHVERPEVTNPLLVEFLTAGE